MSDFPKHLSLVHDKPDHFMIHDAKTNTAFPVAKKGLHPAHQMKIMKMQKFAEGGDVEDEAPEAGNQPQPQQQWMAPMLPPSKGTGEQPVQAQQAQRAPQNATPDMLGQFQANQNMEEQGLKTKGQAEMAQGQEAAKIYKESTDAMSHFLYNANQTAFNQNIENENLANDVANSKVDPNHYRNSMSTGQKISSAIGVILGGIGSGLTHSPNLAYQSMQKAIEDDIQAQKDNIGKKQSLLSMNLQKYKDMRLAEQATMMQMNAMTQGQLASSAAKYGGVQGQAGTQAVLGQLKNKNLQDSMQLKQQIFENQIKQHLAGGDVSQQNPLDYVQHVVPPDKQKEVANELGQAEYASQHHDELMKLYDQASKEQTAVRRIGGIRGNSPALDALNNAVLPVIKDTEGRVNEFEHESVKHILPGMFKLGSTEEEQRKNFETFINGKQNAPLAKTYGIDINRFNSTAKDQIGRLKGEDRQAYDWAKANPGKKESAMILSKLGIK